jgi:hypothetical protein
MRCNLSISGDTNTLGALYIDYVWDIRSNEEIRQLWAILLVVNLFRI